MREKCWVCNGTGEAEGTPLDLLMGDELMGSAIRIVKETAKRHGVKKGDIVGPNRGNRVVRARFEAEYRMKDELDMTLKAIGFVLGGRHHSTIIHGIQRHNGVQHDGR